MEVELLVRHRLRLIGMLAALWSAVFSPQAAAQTDGVDEYRAKAAFIYKFCKFVSWPRHSAAPRRAPFVFGVVGNRPLAKVITQELAGKTIGGRTIQVREFARLHEVEGAQVVYCTTEDLRRLFKPRREKLRGQSVLTVGDGSQFLKAGGMLELRIKEDRLAFGVNLGASRRSGLQMDPNLLNLAEKVLEE